MHWLNKRYFVFIFSALWWCFIAESVWQFLVFLCWVCDHSPLISKHGLQSWSVLNPGLYCLISYDVLVNTIDTMNLEVLKSSFGDMVSHSDSATYRVLWYSYSLWLMASVWLFRSGNVLVQGDCIKFEQVFPFLTKRGNQKKKKEHE